MKKKFIFLIFLNLFMVSMVIKGNGQSEKIIYRYNTNTPVTFKDGSGNVTVPTTYVAKKQELRGAWVATVYNLDINQQNGTTASAINAYKQQYLNILNTLESYNMNAVFFQVRPTNDAFYKSNLNPWSNYLTGTQGKDPGWDPLEWMVEETHKRGMEYHAWFNPYRVSTASVSSSETKQDILNKLSADNFARKNPDLVIVGSDNKLILNPGEPKVQQFIIDTVMEVAQNYDIDAIHFDDYFYPYGGVGTADKETYNKYNPNRLSIEDWRRENINIVIRGIKQVLSQHNQINNKAVQFGISPFGIWANKSSNPLGSNTNGSQSYSVQYADTRKWVKEEWVDYILPQIYWDFERDVAPYADLVKWWADVVKGTKVNLYIGHGIHNSGNSSANIGWLDANQIPDQILFNQKYEEVKGSVFYSYKYLTISGNSQLISGRNLVKQYFNSSKVILPTHKNLSDGKPNEVLNLSATSLTSSVKLEWDKRSDDKFYVVYRFDTKDSININDSSKIKAIIYPTEINKVTFIDNEIKTNTIYQYVITAFDKTNNESNGVVIENEPILTEPRIENALDINIYTYSGKPNYLQNVRAYDIYGNNVTSNIIVDDSEVLLNTVGTYNVTYKLVVNDKEVTKTIKVNVLKNIVVINNTKDFRITVGSNKPNYLANIKAIDSNSLDVTTKLTVDDSNVNLNVIGTYYITYKVELYGEQFIKTVKVIVEDKTPPVITSPLNIYLNYNQKAIDWTKYITAHDSYDGDVSDLIIVDDKNLDTTKLGLQELTVTLVDKSGNKNVIKIKVYIEDLTGPVINGYKDYQIIVNSQKPNWLEGVTAIDNYDGNITNEITVDDSNVNLNKKGTYYVTFKITDSNGNTTIETITVDVIDNKDNNFDINKILIIGGVLIIGVGVISIVNIGKKRH